jgi:hypothetical protein
MAHVRSHSDKVHLAHNTFDRVESVILLSLVGSGLAACALGAFIFDIGRWLSIW